MSTVTPARRRGHGEGSIYYVESKGLWATAISLPDGKRRYLYAKTKREVQAKLRQAQQDLDGGILVSPDRQTVGQFLTDWLENTAKPSVRAKTYASYAVLINKHILPRLGRHHLQKLTPKDVQTFMRNCLVQGG
jgi:predicted Zn-dependent peptidase